VRQFEVVVEDGIDRGARARARARRPRQPPGTFISDVEITAGYVRSGVHIPIGHTTIAVRIIDRDLQQPIAPDHAFGPLLGASAAMRSLYPLIDRCAASTATVSILAVMRSRDYRRP